MIENIPLPSKAECTVPGCGKTRRRNRSPYCSTHYSRFLKHGDPLRTDTTPSGPRRAFTRESLEYDGDDCLIWPFGRNANGVGEIQIDGKRYSVPAFICEKIYGVRPSPVHQVAHSCGMGHLGCIAKKHLRWATPAENAADKIRHGTSGVGSNNPRAILNERDVKLIREDTRPASAVADQFGVSRQRIWKIRTRQEWRHVD